MLVNETELQDLIKNPAKHFKDPATVLDDERLDLGHKRRILESWKVDEWELSTATDESMGPEESTFLSQVQQALSTLENNT
ncbi:MAG: hypothetical protein ACI8XU_000875 [Kiritimatiellia bacterium]|jgi:hypothetical protein